MKFGLVLPPIAPYVALQSLAMATGSQIPHTATGGGWGGVARCPASSRREAPRLETKPHGGPHTPVELMCPGESSCCSECEPSGRAAGDPPHARPSRRVEPLSLRDRAPDQGADLDPRQPCERTQPRHRFGEKLAHGLGAARGPYGHRATGEHMLPGGSRRRTTMVRISSGASVMLGAFFPLTPQMMPR